MTRILARFFLDLDQLAGRDIFQNLLATRRPVHFDFINTLGHWRALIRVIRAIRPIRGLLTHG